MAQAMRPDAVPKLQRGTTAEGRGPANLAEAQPPSKCNHEGGRRDSGRAKGPRPAKAKAGRGRRGGCLFSLVCSRLLYAADHALRGHSNPIGAPTFT